MLYQYRFQNRPIQFSISEALPIQDNLILNGANITLVPKILTLLLARHLNKLAQGTTDTVSVSVSANISVSADISV